jgi:hypothetical protein
MLEQFISGAIVMGFLVASLLFVKYHKRTRQKLFLTFAASFFLLALNYAWLAISEIPGDERSLLFLVRLLAFALIPWAIFQSSRQDKL